MKKNYVPPNSEILMLSVTVNVICTSGVIEGGLQPFVEEDQKDYQSPVGGTI